MLCRRASYGLVVLLGLGLSGCGVDAQGRQKFAGLGAVEACTCGGIAFALLAGFALVVVVVLARRSKRVSPARNLPKAASHIFISYRRTDSQDVAGRIYDVLVNKFSAEFVFKDVDSIPAGKDFRKVLQEAVRRAEVVVVIIGPRWLKAIDSAGKRRLEDPNDFVRIEIESALQMGIPIIPVMVSNARMVAAADLPTSLQQLAFQNGLPVRPDPDFHRDVARLINALEGIAPNAPRANGVNVDKPEPRGSGGKWLVGCGLAAALIVVAAIVLSVVLYVVGAAFIRM